MRKEICTTMTIISPISNYETRSVTNPLLTVDIIHYNILTKLPAKSLLRFKSVCKDWYNFINSSNFINIHLKHTLQSHDSCDFLVVSLITHVKHSTLFYTYLDAPDYTTGKCMEIETFQNYCRIVGSSNGLICFKFLGSGFLLWNPVTREYSRLIKPPSLARVTFSDMHYGFGYNVVSRDYKIVNIEFRYTTEYGQDCIIHVYSTNSNSWKEAQKYHNSVHKYADFGKSVIVNNKLHWIMVDNNPIFRIQMILMFDLHTEELRKISYPTSLQKHAGCPLELMVSRGCLCTLAAHYSFRSHHSTASMWVMKDYGVVESWTILYEVVGKKISSPQYFEIITHLSRNDSEEVLLLRLFNNEEPELVWYNLENKSITGKADDPATQEYGGDKWVCIPSLAPIPGNDSNKRHTDLAIIDDIKKEVKLAFLAFDGEYHTE